MRHLYVTGEGVILGVAENMPGSRVHVAWDRAQARAWHDGFKEGLPLDDGFAISDEGLRILIGIARPGNDGEIEAEFAQDADEDADTPIRYRLGPKGCHFVRCCHPKTGFREFLKSWRFVGLRGKVQSLGDDLWRGQEMFCDVAAEHNQVYYLKARRLGFSTLGVAYDAWVLRFRNTNARIHLVSRIEDDSKRQLLEPLKAGVELLPDYMQLPELSNSALVLELDAGIEDVRTAQGYAAKAPGRGYGCDHLHLDEWAAMAETAPELPKKVWAAASPSVKPGGTIHILTTGVGPVGFYADMWKDCIGGTGALHACFIGGIGMRPDYTAEHMAYERRRLGDEAKFKNEYPATWEDALAGAGDTLFESKLIDYAAEYARGFSEASTWRDVRGRERNRKYIKAWDCAGPGEHSDAVVGIVLDVTEPVWDVVAMIYHKGEQYPTTAWRIEQLHHAYPGPTYIEDNEAGAAIRSMCDLNEEQCIGHRTTRQSKPVCLSEIQFALEAMELKWNPLDVPKLDAEMRVYKMDDENLEQDCVMALSIAVHYGADAAAESGGRVLGVVRV